MDRIIETRRLLTRQKSDILRLWNEEYPANLSYANLNELESYLARCSGQFHVLVTDREGTVQAWYCDFTRDNEKWFVMLIDKNTQGKGVGSELLNLAKSRLDELNGWVIDHNKDKKQNGENYRSPISFYEKNGFQVLSEVRLELRNISAVKVRWQINKS